jgi:SAM-dependent MidA family methyltransferase
MKTPNLIELTVGESKTMSLKKRIVERISSGGPIPFEEFMEVALYHPDAGFFGSGKLRSEKGGDFLTSPEVSPLFGETVAVFVEEERIRIGEPFQVVEVAAGSGSLLRPLLEKVNAPALAVEASPAARASLAEFVEVRTDLPEVIRGVVIGNELIDNLPMALAQRMDDAWRERWVGVDDGSLVFVDAEPRPGVLDWLDSYAGDVPDGGWVEVQLAAEDWLADALHRLETGAIVLIDYGDTAEGLLPRRQDGTLRTYRAHHLGPHPLDEPGETDITADVNFTALIGAAQDAGADVDYGRQDDFLAGLGLRDRLSDLRHAELEAARAGDEMERLQLRTVKTEVETLLHQRGLGDFRVLVARK